MIKSTTSQKTASKDIVYPKLMIGVRTGSVYLMIDKSVGVILVPGRNSDHKTGEYMDNVLYTALKDYDGVVTMENV